LPGKPEVERSQAALIRHPDYYRIAILELQSIVRLSRRLVAQRAGI
jgi:hypothetical protein